MLALRMFLSFVLLIFLLSNVADAAKPSAKGTGKPTYPYGEVVQGPGGPLHQQHDLLDQLEQRLSEDWPDPVRSANGNETYFSVLDNVIVDADFYQNRLAQLDRLITDPIVVLNLSGDGTWITTRLDEMDGRGTGAGVEIRSITADPGAIKAELEMIPTSSPVILLAHRPANTQTLADLDETSPFDYSEIDHLLRAEGRLGVVAACSSACLAGVSAGMSDDFNEVEILTSITRMQDAVTVGDMFDAMGQTDNPFVLRGTLNGYEGRVEYEDGSEITARAVLGSWNQYTLESVMEESICKDGSFGRSYEKTCTEALCQDVRNFVGKEPSSCYGSSRQLATIALYCSERPETTVWNDIPGLSPLYPSPPQCPEVYFNWVVADSDTDNGMSNIVFWMLISIGFFIFEMILSAVMCNCSFYIRKVDPNFVDRTFRGLFAPFGYIGCYLVALASPLMLMMVGLGYYHSGDDTVSGGYVLSVLALLLVLFFLISGAIKNEFEKP